MSLKFEGQKHYEVLNALLRDNNIFEINNGVEVGVRYGDTAEYLLHNNPRLHLYLVDPYAPYMDVANYFYTKEEQEDIKEKARVKVSNAARCFEDYGWVYKSSVEAAKEFKKDSIKFDFVFIDACHEYKNVKEDIAAWAPLVRKGGLLTGHDFSMDGVRKAVDEFMVANKKEVYHTGPATDVWAIEM